MFVKESQVYNFLRKAWRFLRILKWAGHPILRPFFLEKAGVFLKNLKMGRSPDIDTISLEKRGVF
jgi:hypothetical protein